MTSTSAETVDASVCRLCGQNRALEKYSVPKKKEDVSERIKQVLCKILAIIVLIIAIESTGSQTRM